MFTDIIVMQFGKYFPSCQRTPTGWELPTSLTLLTISVIATLSLCNVTVMAVLYVGEGSVNRPFSYTF